MILKVIHGYGIVIYEYERIKNMNDKRMAIVMVGYDGYDDVWKDFFTLFQTNWKDCPYRIYLADGEKGYEMSGLINVHAGKEAEWSRKVQKALEVVEEKYICLLLEDFYFGSAVDNKIVSDALDLMDRDGLKYYKLNTFSKIKTTNYKNIDYLHVLPGNLEYAVSLQPGIWERDFLKEKVGTENYNAWKFEVDRINEEKNASKEPLKGCVFDERNILQIQHGIVQGKYLPECVRYFKKRGYELNQSRRSVMTGWENFIYKAKRLNWPKPIRQILKNILRLFGMKFVTDANA